MKRNSTKTLKWLAGAVIIFGALYVLMLGSQTYGFFTGNTIQQAVPSRKHRHIQIHRSSCLFRSDTGIHHQFHQGDD